MDFIDIFSLHRASMYIKIFKCVHYYFRANLAFFLFLFMFVIIMPFRGVLVGLIVVSHIKLRT